MVLLVPAGFVVLAIVSLGDNLRSVSCGKHTHDLCGASVQHKFHYYMCMCLANQCPLTGLVLQCAQCTCTVHAHCTTTVGDAVHCKACASPPPPPPNYGKCNLQLGNGPHTQEIHAYSMFFCAATLCAGQGLLLVDKTGHNTHNPMGLVSGASSSEFIDM